jgi:hypothetical protein
MGGGGGIGMRGGVGWRGVGRKEEEIDFVFLDLGQRLGKKVEGITTGEANFPECHALPRVPKIGHSGKKIFPECCTRGRNALGEDGHTKKKSCI